MANIEDVTYNPSLSTSAFYILLAVADRPLHGYAILEQVAYDSGSQVFLATGTVYTIAKRLVERHLLEIIAGSGHIAHRYRITETGRRRLGQEIKRLDYTLARARRKLGE